MRGAWVAWAAVSAVVVAAWPGRVAAGPVTLDGAWTGTVLLGAASQPSSAAATLSQTGRVVSGALTVTAGGMSGPVTVAGTAGRRLAKLTGVLGPQRLRWKGRWSQPQQAWRGPLVMSGAGPKTRGVLRLVRPDGGPRVRCGTDYFASDAMPGVFERICAQCHVPGGAAQGTRLRVTPGDPSATATSALGLVDLTDPPRSLLLRKPRGEVAHGGGVRFAPDSTEDRTLTHWIELVTAPGCGGDGGGTGNLYTDNCATCHGADAGGLGTAPGIRCATRITDAVQQGRGAAMPSFPGLTAADLATLFGVLGELCTLHGRTGADLFAGNCASCHGAAAGGGQSGLGVRGPDIRCTGAGDYREKVSRGDDRMPAFPALDASDVSAIVTFVHATSCPGG